jgi:hypothetical protein
MVQIGNVPQINEVKSTLDHLKDEGKLLAWELPYENILTRLTAAIFFLTPADENSLTDVEAMLGRFPMFTWKKNDEKLLSQLEWQVEFNKGFEL